MKGYGSSVGLGGQGVESSIGVFGGGSGRAEVACIDFDFRILRRGRLKESRERVDEWSTALSDFTDVLEG